MWEILFRYQDFVAINKPQGISVHRSGGEVSLTATLAAQLGVEKVWLLHRLDKQAGGILLFALNPQSAAVLAAQFAERKMKKTYLALSDRKPSKKQGWIKGGGKIQARDVEADAQYGKYCRYPVFQYPHQ
ncbi:hypothetical protein HZO49_002145 [Neisseria gonorrhoeae]